MANALVLTTSGINCDRELAHAFELAGATAELVHLNRILADPKMIDRYDLIGLPGGFSYGDAVAAGRIAAALMRETLYPAFVAAVARGVPIIALCNGFQIAVQMGLLPGPAVGEPWPAASPRPTAALATNDTARFVDRWCGVEIPAGTRCIWTQGIDPDETAAVLPVAHGEGRFTVANGDLLSRLDSDSPTGRSRCVTATATTPTGRSATWRGSATQRAWCSASCRTRNGSRAGRNIPGGRGWSVAVSIERRWGCRCSATQSRGRGIKLPRSDLICRASSHRST